MVAVTGIYQDGLIKLDKEYTSNRPVKVIVTFLENNETEPEKVLKLSDFSFAESQKVTANFKGSFSDALTEERRSE